jgi:protein SCO1/2
MVLVLAAPALLAQTFGRPAVFQGVGIEQHMGAQIPLDATFADEQGQPVTLRKFAGKPVLLALVYYQCPSLCDLVLNATVRAAKGVAFKPGKDYEIVAVSFDPRENYILARDKKQSYMKQVARPDTEAGWHFLTGQERSVRELADAVGFHYRFDPDSNQFAHPSSVMILTPDGKISRYFYGIEYPAFDVRLGLIEASGGKIGSPVDAVQLFCFHYDPTRGKYGLVIINVLRLMGIATAGALAIFMIVMFRRDAKQARIEGV